MKYLLLLSSFIFINCISLNDNNKISQQNNNLTPQMETLQWLDSYQTNLKERDIAIFFRHSANRYLSQANYYHIMHEVDYRSDQQQYSWACEILKYTFQWGILYEIILYTNNGTFVITTRVL